MIAQLAKSLLFSCATLGVIFASPSVALSKAKLTVLHSFAGGTDGATPYSTLIMGKKGDLYGTTLAGGTANLGTVFMINKKGVETVLHSFTGGNDGANPYAGLIFGADGALYGTTYYGGPSGLGTVYKITTSGTETVLHAFQGIYNNTDGSFPYGALVLFSDGNMYGTTVNGGGPNNTGTIYGVEPSGAVTVLYSFGDPISGDGNHPYSNLTEGVDIFGDDELMGTTEFGSDGWQGDSYNGTVFAFIPPFAEFENSDFTDTADGQYPMAGVVFTADNKKHVISTASRGGAYGLGTVFLGSSAMIEAPIPLYSFQGIYNAADGSYPNSALVLGSDGNYYGTTQKGGNSTDNGTIYSYHYNLDDLTGTESIVYRFSGSNGSQPYGAVIEGKPGIFYGTTSTGGANNLGVVYKLVVK